MDVGDKARISVTFTVDDVATDPTALTFKYRIGTGDVTTYTYGSDDELEQDSTGNYHVDIDCTTAGTYYVRYAGTGAAAAAAESSFTVVGSHF